jgi:glycine cleavage system H protein
MAILIIKKSHNQHNQKIKMNIPAGLKYTQEHEWVSIEGDVATVGITDFAQSNLGDIVYVDIDTQGKTVAQNEVFGTVEAVKTVADLFMPLSGEIIEVNTDLDQNPEAVNTDPYHSGWMVRIKLTNPAEVAALLDEAAYSKHTA